MTITQNKVRIHREKKEKKKNNNANHMTKLEKSSENGSSFLLQLF